MILIGLVGRKSEVFAVWRRSPSPVPIRTWAHVHDSR